MRHGGGDRACPIAAAALVLLVAAGCAAPEAKWQAGPDCGYEGIAFTASFAGGRLSGCRQTAPDAFTLAFEPEGRPINPSPWYAFDVVIDERRTLDITLDYGDFTHRYAPKVKSSSGWEPVEGTVRTSEADTRAHFRFEAPSGTSRIAAQEILAPADARAWVQEVAAATSLEDGVLGLSAESRPILSLAGGTALSGTLVVTGRQHPPEVTGAFALRAFVARLAADDPLAERFRAEYGVFVVPMLNPDGVARGHWRFDASFADLNRDWGPFERPETRLVRDTLADLSPVLILDFHSTTRDVLYTPPDDADIARAGFPGAWHAAINARLDGAPLARGAAHNPGNPTLKSWAPTVYGIPAITFEVGDETPRERIDAMARIAAEEAMRLLLETSAVTSSRGGCPCVDGGLRTQSAERLGRRAPTAPGRSCSEPRCRAR